MSKRRVASELMFCKSHGFKYPVRVVAVTSGTGTCTQKGVITLVASATATSVYLALETGTNIGTLVGTGVEVESVN